jgi:hypothetical protein
VINKGEVCRDLKLIEARLLQLKSAKCLSESLKQIENIIDSVNSLESGLTLGMTPSITGRNIPSDKCNFCGK